MRIHRARRRDAGFTLIEILVTLAIIAILAAILISNFLRAQAQARVAASKGNVKNISLALETYFAERDSYPSSLPLLVPTYAKAIPPDPCTNTVYVYDTSMGGLPPSDYKLSVSFPLLSTCRVFSPGISYTPGGGLIDSP